MPGDACLSKSCESSHLDLLMCLPTSVYLHLPDLHGFLEVTANLKLFLNVTIALFRHGGRQPMCVYPVVDPGVILGARATPLQSDFNNYCSII